ncbi:synaptonemal complex central element protein 1-like isoform X3 [Phyllobates terribilis]|uniref:synaptonemal complex central element protein 1-like isoform X3 n=1 Tax=Phyllobates terribilis TaxID=111132 RepID=UPI003CCB374F
MFGARGEPVCTYGFWEYIRYHSITLWKFLDLITDFFGGKAKMLEELGGQTVAPNPPPCCCCCCFPNIVVNSDMETLLGQTADMSGGGRMDPKMDDVLKKITMVQKDREQSEAEKQELDKEIEAEERELQKLYAEKTALKETLLKKQETVRLLKLKRDNQLKKEKKMLEQAEESKKRIDDLTTKIKEEKLKQRKQRIEFQDQMEDLMKQHKALAKFYDAKRLGAETDEMKERKKELLLEEKEKSAKLQELEETEADLREKGVLTSENLFLRSEQATCAIKLFEEENNRSKVMIEEETLRQTEVLNTYNRLKSRLEDAERKLPKVSQALAEKPQTELSKGAFQPSSILFSFTR